jgi:hypothetical protein
VAKCPKKDLQCIVWEYGGRNGNASLDWKSRKNQDVSRA